MTEHTTIYIKNRADYIFMTGVAKFFKKPVYELIWDEALENIKNKYSNLDFNNLDKKLSIYDTLPTILEPRNIQRKKIEHMPLLKLQKFNAEHIIPLQNMVIKAIEFKKEFDQ